MAMKSTYKPKAKLSRTPTKAARNRRRTIKTLAAQGFSTDMIAAKLGLNKNHLRAEHALDLHAGREIRRADKVAAEAAELTHKERQRLEVIKGSFDSHWYTPEHGNDLFGNTHSVAEALAWCKEKFGDR